MNIYSVSYLLIASPVHNKLQDFENLIFLAGCLDENCIDPSRPGFIVNLDDLQRAQRNKDIESVFPFTLQRLRKHYLKEVLECMIFFYLF